jgi:hypothetical protein
VTLRRQLSKWYFAQYDGPSQLEKGLGKDGFAAWQAKASRYVNSVRRFVIRTRPDLSNEGKRTGPPKLAVVTHIHVAPGRGQDFENYTKNEFLPVLKQGQATYHVAKIVFGGDVNEYVTLTLRESFADIDKGPVAVQVLGAEGAAKLLQKLPTGTVMHVERCGDVKKSAPSQYRHKRRFRPADACGKVLSHKMWRGSSGG